MSSLPITQPNKVMFGFFCCGILTYFENSRLFKKTVVPNATTYRMCELDLIFLVQQATVDCIKDIST